MGGTSEAGSPYGLTATPGGRTLKQTADSNGDSSKYFQIKIVSNSMFFFQKANSSEDRQEISRMRLRNHAAIINCDFDRSSRKYIGLVIFEIPINNLISFDHC